MILDDDYEWWVGMNSGGGVRDRGREETDSLQEGDIVREWGLSETLVSVYQITACDIRDNRNLTWEPLNLIDSS
jgi:hypothetical protein